MLDVVPAYAPPVGFGIAAAHWWDRGHGETDLEPWAGVVLIVLSLWPCVYFAIPRTLGKLALKLRVRGAAPRSWLRGLWAVLPLAGFVSPFLFVLLLVDAGWPWFDHRLALHDRLAGTEVLRPVWEAPAITRLRRVGAAGRRDYAEAAVRWARAHARLDPDELAKAERLVFAAADDPEAARTAWGFAESAVTMPRMRELEDLLADVDEYGDAELERLWDEAYDAQERALVAVEARFRT